MITDEAIKEAWDRIARTPDGVIIYADFQRLAMRLVTNMNSPDGALRWQDGRRSVAHEKMALMATGIEESGGRSDHTGGTRSERLLVFSVRQSAGGGDARKSVADWRREQDRGAGGSSSSNS